jgi:GMP synthase (glutamine-hydrolysing)
LPPPDPGAPWALAQHAAHEGPGLIAPALAAAGVELRPTRVDLGEALPAVGDVGGVVVMGGPMGVHDDAEHPWLAQERRWLLDAVDAGVPVLGVCLGAQQLAAALGAEVVTGPAPEIGTGTVTLTSDGEADPVLGPEGPALPAVHWHGDTFGIPEGAVRLASSDRYENQAFRHGRCVYGLQFHVEVDRVLAARWAPELPVGCVLDALAVDAVDAVGRRVLGRFVSHALGT